MKRRNFTQIPNEIFSPNNLTTDEKLLLCILLRHYGENGPCYVGQELLARELGCSKRYLYKHLVSLRLKKLVIYRKLGFNRPNVYAVSKSYLPIKNYRSQSDKNSSSYHLRTTVPLQWGTTLLPKNMYLKDKDKRDKSNPTLIREIIENKRVKND